MSIYPCAFSNCRIFFGYIKYTYLQRRKSLCNFKNDMNNSKDTLVVWKNESNSATWSQKEKRGRETVKPTCFSLLYVESDFGTADTKSFTVFFARWGVKFDRQLRISAVELDNSTIESMCRRGERKACSYIVLWILISLLYYCLIWPLMSRCVTTQVLVNSQKRLIFTFTGNV